MSGVTQALLILLLGQATPAPEILPVLPRPPQVGQPPAQADRPVAPVRGDPVFTSLHLGGRVVRDATGLSTRDYWVLEARLRFTTTQADVVVPIGFSGLRLTTAQLDGALPRWTTDEAGLAIIVAEPGQHTLMLTARVPVQQPSGDRRFVASIEQIPRAAITSIDVTLPYQVQSAAVKGGGSLDILPAIPLPSNQMVSGAAQSAARLRVRVYSEALGVLSAMELSWQLPSPRGAAAVYAVTGTQEVTVRERVAETEARLSIELREGTSSRIRFRLPPGARNLVVWDDARKTQLKATLDLKTDEVTLILPAPLAGERNTLTLLLQFLQPHKGTGDTLSLGRLELLDAFGSTQSGSLQIQVAADLHLRFLRNPGQRSAGQFAYGQQPYLVVAQLETPTPIAPVVEARPNYRVQVSPTVLAIACEWQITRLSRLAVAEWEVRWPEGFVLDRRNLPPGVRVDEPVDGLVRVHLRDPLTQVSTLQPYRLTLEGWLPAVGMTQASFEPPVLLRAGGEHLGRRLKTEVLGQSGDWTFARGPFDLVLRGETSGLQNAKGWPAETNQVFRGPATFVVDPRAAASPWRVALAWEAPKVEVQTRVEAYVTTDRVQIVQSLVVANATRLPERLWVNLPPGLENVSGGRLRGMLAESGVERAIDEAIRFESVRAAAEGSDKALRLPSGLTGSCELVFEWTFSPQDDWFRATLPLAFLTPDTAIVMAAGAEVRVWTAVDVRVVLADGDKSWQAKLPTAGPDAEATPALHAAAASLQPLPWRAERVASAAPDLVAERVLVEVGGRSGERWLVRASYWFSQVRRLPVQMRLPEDALVTKVRVNGLDAPAFAVGNEAAPLLTLALEPRQLARTCLLEVTYRIPAPRRWDMAIESPVLLGQAIVGAVRWRIEVPENWVSVYNSPSVLGEQSWRWLPWLRPAAPKRQAAEMAAWLSPSLTPFASSPEGPALSFGSAETPPTLRMVLVPQQAWVLCCSLFVLIVGVIAACYRTRLSFVLLALTLAGLIAVGVLAQQLCLAFLAGAQPGMLALGLVLAILFVRRRRWQRSMLLLPGFSRQRVGSTLQRPPITKAPRPASTHEAAPAVAATDSIRSRPTS
jgi:hypothetical protein